MRIQVREDDLMLGLGGLAGLGALDVAGAASALTPCAVRAVTNPSSAGECIWDAIKSLVLESPEAETLLMQVASSDCSTVLSMLGLPAEATSLICALPQLARIWAIVQGKARRELLDRYRNRGSATQGGRSLVDAAGNIVGLICPSYLVPFYDENGAKIGMQPEPESYYGVPWVSGGAPYDPGMTCPKAPVQLVAAKPAPPSLTLRPGSAQPGDQQEQKSGAGGAAVPWYKNKWTYIIGGLVVVGGIGAVALSRRGR